MNERFPRASGLALIGGLLAPIFSGVLVGQPSQPGVPSQEAQQVLDILLADGELTSNEVNSLDPRDWAALRRSCTVQYEHHKRTGRQFRTWGVIHDKARGHLAPIRTSHRNGSQDLETGRFAAVFKIQGVENAGPIDEDDFSGLFEGRGCILVVRNTNADAASEYGGVAVPYEEDFNSRVCQDHPSACPTVGRYQAIRVVPEEANHSRREGAQWHEGDLPPPNHFDSPADRVRRVAGQHSPLHYCFSCIELGWCEG